MARPQRNNVEYFPFICEEGKKMYYIEERYGNDGFATFVKILRELAKADYHYLNLSTPSTLMFLSAKCKVSKEVLQSIIEDLVELGKFNKPLWDENKIIWCQDFIDSIQDAYIKRKSKCIDLNGLFTLLHGLGVRKLSKLPLNGVINTQSIVNNRIEDKSKVNNIILSNTNTEYLKFENLENQKNWEILLQQKKWKKKSISAIEKAYNLLIKFSDTEINEAINKSIIGEYQGVFPIKTKENATNKSNFEKREAADRELERRLGIN